jgi:thioesterase domain-containing protein
MSAAIRAFLTLAGAGGGHVDPSMFADPPDARLKFLALELPDWRWHLAAARTHADLVQHLVAQASALVPDGPLRFVGTSLGGHLAFETAVRLQAAGRAIGGLCLLDTFFGRPPVAAPTRFRRELGRAWRGGTLGRFVATHVSRRSLGLWSRLRSRAWQQHARAGTWPWDLRPGSLLEREWSMRLLLRLASPAAAAEPATPLAAPVLLLRTTEGVRDDDTWRRRCPRLEVHELPGDHHTLGSPETAQAIRPTFSAGTRDWR